MITHRQDRSKSGSFKINRWWYHYATLCGLSFRGGGGEHRIAEPEDAPTCKVCEAIAAERTPAEAA